MKRRFHLRKLVGASLGLLVFAISASSQAQPPSSKADGFAWRFTISLNQVAPSSITAENICRHRHRFEVDSRQLPSFMHLLGNSSFDVNSHSQHVVPVEFDSTKLKAGEYEGVVVIKCVNCKQETDCKQDREFLHIYMTVAPQSPDIAGAMSSHPDQSFVPGRVLVLIPFESPASVEATAKTLAASHQLGVVGVHRLVSLNAALIVYSLPPGADVQQKIAELLPEVLIVQPDFLYRTLGAGQEDDSLAQLQYGRKLIHADQLDASVTGRCVRVAIVDTGIDSSHPALKGRITEEMDFTATGFTPDIHGTLLAGIIGSEQKNGAGIRGVAPGAEILSIKACQPLAVQSIQARCWSLTLARGLDYAIQNKARVINLSLGGPAEKLLQRLIDEAVNRRIVVVAAAGNDGPHGQPSFPAALPNVMAVTAVDASEQLYPDATQGDFIQVAAPGVEIVSTSPGGKLLVSSGTSMATAFVSGTAALFLQQSPQLSPPALQSLVQRTAKDLGPPGKDPQFGSGLIDACKAIKQINGGRKLCH